MTMNIEQSLDYVTAMLANANTYANRRGVMTKKERDLYVRIVKDLCALRCEGLRVHKKLVAKKAVNS